MKLIDRKRIHAEADVYLKRLGLNLSSRTPLKSLSIAQQQMVEIAKALSLNARILIMDEPTSSLTLTETARLLDSRKGVESAGRKHHLHLSSAGRNFRPCRPRSRLARWAQRGHACARRDQPRPNGQTYGRPRPESLLCSHATTGKPGYFKVQNLRTRRYPEHAVSFDVGQGEILGLAGLVGAGRSEIAQAIFGVETALEGHVFLNEKPINISSPKDAIANGIYLVSEDRRKTGLILEMPIRENITLPRFELTLRRG